MVVDTKYSIQNKAMVDIQDDKDNCMLAKLKNQLKNLLQEKNIRLDQLFQKLAVR